VNSVTIRLEGGASVARIALWPLPARFRHDLSIEPASDHGTVFVLRRAKQNPIEADLLDASRPNCARSSMRCRALNRQNKLLPDMTMELRTGRSSPLIETRGLSHLWALQTHLRRQDRPPEETDVTEACGSPFVEDVRKKPRRRGAGFIWT